MKRVLEESAALMTDEPVFFRRHASHTTHPGGLPGVTGGARGWQVALE